MAAVRVVVADDDVLLREGLASLLDRSGFEVVGQAGDATRAAGGNRCLHRGLGYGEDEESVENSLQYK